ncbi:MAG: OmpA family protein [Alphaproteobacteria bacterium]|jgi:OOP family OmpA-OmpF porin|nr:OmpA family protein [Alphaproteobacteria bacterium]
MSLLAACGTMDGDTIAGMENKGDSFAKSLQAGYVALGKSEVAEYDWQDGDYFFNKAIAAASGSPVLPTAMSERKIPESHVGTLTAARQRLMTALDATARMKIPSAAARAQTMFDCWMQEQEENHQPKDIAACRAAFEAAMKAVDEAMKPKMMAKPKPKPAPPPKPVVDGLYLVFFDFDDARPAATSGKAILKAISDYKLDKPKNVRVTGHTDLAGSDEYNYALSVRRAETIRAMLADGGIPANVIVTNAAGESRPLRPTADGVREARNRRVEIEFE